MEQDRLSTIRHSASELLEAWKALWGEIEGVEADDGGRFDSTHPIPDLGLTINDLDVQVNLVAGSIAQLPAVSGEELSTVPPFACLRLEEAFQKATESANNLSNTLEQKLTSFDPETFQGKTTEERPNNQPPRERTVKIAQHLVGIARPLDDAFARLIQIKQSLPSSDGQSVFPGLIQRVREVVAEIQSARDKAHDLHNQCNVLAEEAATATKESQKSAGKADEARQASLQAQEACEAAQHGAETSLNEAQKAQREIESVLSEAKSLKTQVDNYQAQFTAFQESLDKQKKELAQGTEEQQRLIGSLQEIEEEIKDKNGRAAQMLGHATVAGLAATFGTTRDKLDDELKKARLAFYISISVLALLAAPMVFYITTEGQQISLEGVLARFLILIPGVWLTGFTAKRHSALFRLREHYEYKYNMAYSVEGFKDQTDEQIAPAIAGTTFYELLTRNPADVMDGGRFADTEAPPHPLRDTLMKYFRRGGQSDGEG